MAKDSQTRIFAIEYRRAPYIQSEAFPEFLSVHFPLVYLKLQHNGREVICNSVIDSGAHSCIFPYSMGEELGLNVDRGKRGDVYGGETVFYWEINVVLEDHAHFPLYAGFSKEGDDRKSGLLGQLGFFDKFDIQFNLSNNQIVLSPTSPLVKIQPPS